MENVEKGLTVCTKMGADKSIKSTPNAPKLCTQAQKFGMSMKKMLHWASIVRDRVGAK